MSETAVRLPKLSKRVSAEAHLEQYLGAWAMHDAQGMYRLVAGMDLGAHIAKQRDSRADNRERSGGRSSERRSAYEVVTGAVQAGGAHSIALLEVRGMVTKYGSSLGEPHGMLRLRQALRKAADDDSIGGILLVIDSPGGTVSGTHDFAQDIAKAALRKPVHAYIEDLGASAAYWIASQCSRVSCNASAVVGAIGTYAVVEDSSAQAQREGITVHVVRAGAFKGAGEPGTEVTEEQLAHWQEMVDRQNDFFVRGVSSGRGMPFSRAAELADGRVHVGKSAVALGLADAVESLDEAMTALMAAAADGEGSRAKAAARSRMAHNDAGAGALEEAKEAQVMSATTTKKSGRAAIKAETAKSEGEGGEEEEEEEEETGTEASKKSETAARAPAAPVAATIGELKAALPNSTAEFRETCLEQGLTVAQAKGMWASQPKAAASTEAKGNRYGSPGVSAGIKGGAAASTADGDPVAETNRRVEELMKNGMDRSDAIKSVFRTDRELHQNYLMATNPGRRARALIADKMADD